VFSLVVPGFGAKEPERPVDRCYITSDSTYEALGELLTGNPNGLMVHRDELVALLRTLDREEFAAALAGTVAVVPEIAASWGAPPVNWPLASAPHPPNRRHRPEAVTPDRHLPTNRGFRARSMTRQSRAERFGERPARPTRGKIQRDGLAGSAIILPYSLMNW
jgi:hypothetical protein